MDKDLSKLNVQIEPEVVNVTIEIEEYSKEVPITLRQIGEPQEDVTINELTPSFDSVKVYGNRATLDALQELVVEVDVSKLTESKELELKIPLPKGVSRISESQIEVDADVTPAPVKDTLVDDSVQ